MNIGTLKLKNNLFLAPMVDVTDLPYRLLCTEAGMKYTEMLYVDAILHENPKTEQLMDIDPKDGPVGIQITGNNEEEFERFVASKKWKKFDLIDLNCGCPSTRITGNEAGSFLLNSPEKIANIVRILKKTKKPVTVKIRLGFKKNNVLKVARVIEDAGADALTVHVRLATHGRDVPADWKWFAKIRKEISIPFIGNGDVFSGKDAAEVLKVCDGVMIARGAIGDPTIFGRVLHYLKTGEEQELDVEENLKLYKKYLRLEKKYFGDSVDIGRVKYLGGKFLRGFRGAGEARQKLMSCKNISEIGKILNSISFS